MDLNFHPAVKCPYCGYTNHPAISGWGGELSTRTKVCRYCQTEYVLVVYSTTDKELDCTTSRLNSIRDRIKFLRQRIREMIYKVDNKRAEQVEEFIRVEASTRGRQN